LANDPWINLSSPFIKLFSRFFQIWGQKKIPTPKALSQVGLGKIGLVPLKYFN